MQVPPGFNNFIRVIAPVTEETMNAEISAQNSAGNWLMSVAIMDSTEAALLFAKNFADTYGYSAPQRMRLLDLDQSTIDTENAAQLTDGYVPTGMFLDPSTPGAVYINYQLLAEPIV